MKGSGTCGQRDTITLNNPELSENSFPQLNLKTGHNITTKDRRLIFIKGVADNASWTAYPSSEHKYSKVDKTLLAAINNKTHKTLKDLVKEIEEIYSKAGIATPLTSQLIRNNFYYIKGYDDFSIVKNNVSPGWEIFYSGSFNKKQLELSKLFGKEVKDIIFNTRHEALSYFSYWIQDKKELLSSS